MTYLIPKRPKSVTEIDRERYERELKRPKTNGAEQLTLFQAFAANTPAEYTTLLEFFDAVPKFILTPQTSLRAGANLEIKRFEFMWGADRCSVSITPVVVDAKSTSSESIRKEILPGPREETIYRVLKKMAADPEVDRIPKEKSVVIRFTYHQLRMRLRKVGHEFKIAEIREALEVLNRSVIAISNIARKRKLYSGPYIDLSYYTDENDPSGQTSLVEVGFNELAVAAVRAQLYDRIHFERLMSLKSLAAWIYELITRNFRQANNDLGYKLSYKRVIEESGLPIRKDTRSTVRYIRQALNELVEKGVLTAFPAFKEEVIWGAAPRKGGRPPIRDVIWTLFPHQDVVRDIRSDNADQLKRRQSLELSAR